MKSRRPVDLVFDNLVVVAALILTVWCWIRYPLFLRNAPVDLLKRTGAYLIMALGMGGVMMVGGTDLSAGRIMSFVSIVCTSLLMQLNSPTRVFPYLKYDVPIPAVLILVLIIGGTVGLFNGLLVGRLKVKSWIVTLSIQMMLIGLTLVYLSFGVNKGNNFSNLRTDYRGIFTGKLIMGLPNYVWFAVPLTAVVWFVWNKTKLGHEMRLVGLNRQAAFICGVNVSRVITTAYVMAGVLYAWNGFIETARVGGGSAGNGAECDAIAACLIGGVSMRGGRGQIGGIVFGVVILQLISECLQWMSVSANYVYIIKGAIILIAAACDMRRYWKTKKPQELL